MGSGTEEGFVEQDLLLDRIGRAWEVDGRVYTKAAYGLVLSAIDYATGKYSLSDLDGRKKHVSPLQLALGFAEFVINEYGPMSDVVLKELRIQGAYDLGMILRSLETEELVALREHERWVDYSRFCNFGEVFNPDTLLELEKQRIMLGN